LNDVELVAHACRVLGKFDVTHGALASGPKSDV
jgi:hypothetical protein